MRDSMETKKKIRLAFLGGLVGSTVILLAMVPLRAYGVLPGEVWVYTIPIAAIAIAFGVYLELRR